MALALLGGPGSRAAAQATPEGPRAKKSVYGKLESVNTRLHGLFMTLEDGKRLAWQLNAAVIAEVEKVEPGSPMIVIYRQITPTEKRVTAVAFPGTAKTPTYVNLTGERVALRSAPMVDGACSATAAARPGDHHPDGRDRRGRGRLLVLRGRGRSLHARQQVGGGPGPARRVLRVTRGGPRKRAG